MPFKLQTNFFLWWNIAQEEILVSIFKLKITSLRNELRFTLQKLFLRLKIFIDEGSYFEIWNQTTLYLINKVIASLQTLVFQKKAFKLMKMTNLQKASVEVMLI